MDFTEGTTYRIPYPFCRSEYAEQDRDSFCISLSWCPGCVHASYDFETSIAHGQGLRILTCLRIVQLPSPDRPKVLYRQTWQDPDGKVFGNRMVRMCSLPKFAGLLNGYRFPYTIKDNP
jgi:hypothetical protein